MNPGYQFLKDRGFKSDTIKEFDLMYYDGELIHSMPATSSSGICESIRPLFKDTFRHSIIFPIHDAYGTLVAVSARRLDGTKPKFDASVFNKSDILYGLHKTHKDILERNSVFITEGPFDFLMLWQFGIKNAVSSLGCSLSFNQMINCLRLTNNFYIIYDNDEAGNTGAVKAYKALKSYNCNCKIIQLPYDLDEYLIKHGVEEFLKHAQTI